ncbi:MAG: serine/threonine-protein kinase [Acidobacteriota bacterium]
MLSPGDLLEGRYEIVSLMASGGMGAVYRARRTLLLDEVAIKVIRADPNEPAVRERFMRESRASARLRHPAIVSIFDFDIDASGTPFLVMELLSGPSLKDEIAARGHLDAADIQRILPQLCNALQMAHASGIVHRDLKPANIVRHDFSSGEQVYKIVDFGIANIRDATDATETDETRLTGAGQFLGTVEYASPEQLSGRTVGPASDVYSLGVVVFEMLAGRLPFQGRDMFEMVTGHLSSPVPDLDAIRADIPAWLGVVVERALAKDPADRWPTIAHFGAAIAAGAGLPAGRASAGSALLATYEIGARIGPGRLGSEVYRGVHRALGHPVAIRMVRSGGQRNWEGVRARFLREARTLQLAHPSILQVRDYGEEGDLVYVVTDFIEGPSLRELMASSGPLPWLRLRPLLAQLLEAARALLDRGGLLAGLTPEIMRIARDDRAESGEPLDGDPSERLMISTAGIWQAQDLLATLQEQTLRGLGLADQELRYVAPELMTGQTADVRSDVFTIGVLAYEMATGTLPYDGPSMPALLGAMLKGAPVNPFERQSTLPSAAAAVILRALSPRPEARFASASELASALLC